jgi:polyphosphate kinase
METETRGHAVTDWGPERFINRELSWLAFNERVLAQAEDPRLPLLERLKFCAIFASNLDEFFMVRVAGLKDQVAAGMTRPAADGMSPRAQLAAIRDAVDRLIDRLEQVHLDVLLPALSEAGVELVHWGQLGPGERKELAAEFEDRVFPILTPLAVDPGHPFPYISNLSLNLAVEVRDPVLGRSRFARVKVPPALPRFQPVGNGRFLPMEQLICAHLDQLFPGMDIVGAWPFRVTRNADLTLNDEEAEDLLEAVEMELRRRRFGGAVRLEVDRTMPSETRNLLVRELDVDEDDVFEQRGLLDCTGYWQLTALDRPELKLPSWSGITPPPLADLEGPEDLFDRIRQRDILVHHPYDSFNDTVTEFLRQASVDPKVLAIKLTLYRTSGDSPVIDALIEAAERGKQVAALIELKARFDEQANIGWARRLEEAGIHVVYGLVGLKIHCKTTLVVRDEPDGIRRYCHIGTGNYNDRTARIYEDLGLLTADVEVGDDLTQLFNFLTGYGREIRYDRLLVAPHSLRHPLEDLIRNEMRSDGGRMTLKLNSLVDPDMIDLLYEASRAGVQIDLVLRGICGLRPGIEGLSDNIRVRSLVGRFLEHSRILYFANAGGPGVPHYYIGSADLMPRNLDRRVEVLVRVDDPLLQDRLQEILDVNLADDTLAWVLSPDGSYHPLDGGTLNAHERFQELADERHASGPGFHRPEARPAGAGRPAGLRRTFE